MSLRRAAPLALVALVLLASQSVAAPTSEVRHSASGKGARWTAVTAQLDGQRLESRLRLDGASSPLAVSARIYLDGSPVSTTNIVLRASGGEQGIAADAPDIAGLRVHVDQTEDGDDFRLGETTVTATVNPEGPTRRGRVSILLYAAAQELEAWDWGVTAPAAVPVLGTRTGSEVFAYSAKDFGGADVAARASYTAGGVGGVQARVNSGSQRTLSLDSRFVGSFATIGTDRLSVSANGYARDCTPSCSFDPAQDATRIPGTGPFVFHLDGSSVGVQAPSLSMSDTDVSLHGALPRPPADGRF